MEVAKIVAVFLLVVAAGKEIHGDGSLSAVEHVELERF